MLTRAGAQVRESGSGAIDSALRDLHSVRQQLITEIREADERADERADELLDERADELLRGDGAR